MAASLLTLPVPELTGLLREAIRSATRDSLIPSSLERMAAAVAKSLVLAAAGRTEMPALTSGQLLTIVRAIDASRCTTRARMDSAIRVAGGDAESSRAYAALLAEQDELFELFDALISEAPIQTGRSSGFDVREITAGVDPAFGARATVFIETKAGTAACGAINAGENEYRTKVLGQARVGLKPAPAVDYCTECGCDEVDHRDSVTHTFTSAIGGAR